MTAFNAAYPWMVLILGFSVVGVTIFSSVIIATGLWFDVQGEFTEKVTPSAVALVIGQVLAMLALTGVHWLLGASCL
jgi:hypothetical protein